MILMIDNYDSFTYNLVQMIQVAGEKVRVCLNDTPLREAQNGEGPLGVVVSPGPGSPQDAGGCVEMIRFFAPRVPLLGVCLGHQALAFAFGGAVVRAPRLMHGKVSMVYHHGRGLFEGLPNPFAATRYHSLIVEGGRLPSCFEVTAWTGEGEVMGIRHTEYGALGIQFHPESILTTAGSALMKNFLYMATEGSA